MDLSIEKILAFQLRLVGHQKHFVTPKFAMHVLMASTKNLPNAAHLKQKTINMIGALWMNCIAYLKTFVMKFFKFVCKISGKLLNERVQNVIK